MKELLYYRDEILSALHGGIGEVMNRFTHINGFSGKVRDRLDDYASRGKLIRGSLVPFAYDRLTGDEVDRRDLFVISAAVELFQSMLLIHDDIMDQDEYRRGKPSVHYQFQGDGQSAGVNDPAHYGLSMGICAGDVAAFMAFGMLSRLSLSDKKRSELIDFISDEMVLVGIAQMQDVHHGEIDATAVSYDAVETMYRHKTGRYTFSLPLSLGALLRGKDKKIRKQLEDIGELLGIIFQIKDDEIGLFGDSQKTGKPRGSDLYEGKKTVYMQTLLELTDAADRENLLNLIGNLKSDEEARVIMNLLEKYSIPQQIENRLGELASDCSSAIDLLRSEAPNLAESLHALLTYNLKRDF